jgi:hypothetical protein
MTVDFTIESISIETVASLTSPRIAGAATQPTNLQYVKKASTLHLGNQHGSSSEQQAKDPLQVIERTTVVAACKEKHDHLSECSLRFNGGG